MQITYVDAPASKKGFFFDSSPYILKVRKGATLKFFIIKYLSLGANWLIINGLALYGIIFALNSTAHSYLIIEWSDNQKISINISFYYMVNVRRRLTGTILPRFLYQSYDLIGCLIISNFFVAFTVSLLQHLPKSISISSR